MNFKTFFNALKKAAINNYVTLLFIALSAGIGFYFVYSIPIGYTEDESANIPRAYAVSEGQFTATPVETREIDGKDITFYGVHDIPESLLTLEVTGNQARMEAYCNIGDDVNPSVTSTDRHYLNAGCRLPDESKTALIDYYGGMKLSEGERHATGTGGASPYSFIAYLPGAAGFTVAKWFDMTAAEGVYAARIASLVFYIIVSAAALYIVRRFAVKWLLLAVALLPGAIVLGLTVNVDSVLLPLSFLFFALCVRAFKDKPLSLYKTTALFIIGGLLPLLKAPYGVMTLAILFLPLPMFQIKRFGWVLRIMVTGLLLIPALLFTLSIAGVDQSTLYALGASDVVRQDTPNIYWIVTQPLDFLAVLVKSFLVADWMSGVGTLTHQRVRLPAFLITISYISLFIAGIYAAKDFINERKQVIFVLLLGGVLAALALPLLTVARGYVRPEIISLQGRYFIPMLPFIFLSLGIMINAKLQLTKASKWWLVLVMLGVLLLAIIWYHFVVHEWSVFVPPAELSGSEG